MNTANFVRVRLLLIHGIGGEEGDTKISVEECRKTCVFDPAAEGTTG